MCVFSGSLSEIWAELECMHYDLLAVVVVVVQVVVLVVVVVVAVVVVIVGVWIALMLHFLCPNATKMRPNVTLLP